MAFSCLPLLEFTYVLWLSIVYLYWNLTMYYDLAGVTGVKAAKVVSMLKKLI